MKGERKKQTGAGFAEWQGSLGEAVWLAKADVRRALGLSPNGLDGLLQAEAFGDDYPPGKKVGRRDLLRGDIFSRNHARLMRQASGGRASLKEKGKPVDLRTEKAQEDLRKVKRENDVAEGMLVFRAVVDAELAGAVQGLRRVFSSLPNRLAANLPPAVREKAIAESRAAIVGAVDSFAKINLGKTPPATRGRPKGAKTKAKKKNA